jgi:hypothetical protein
LIKPIEIASKALRNKKERQVPDLPLNFHDEAVFNAQHSRNNIGA